jgi:hypothetical protein
MRLQAETVGGSEARLRRTASNQENIVLVRTAHRGAQGYGRLKQTSTAPTENVAMNVSLNGARSRSRLDWDAIEHRNERAQAWPRRVFFAATIAFLAYLAWTHFAA